MKMLNLLSQNNKKCFIQFGGQGNNFIKELKRLYKYDELTEYFNFVYKILDEELQDHIFKNLPYFKQGFNLKEWLETGEFPEEEYTTNTIISMPSIIITQIGYIHLFRLKGISMDELLELTSGLIGHSQGIYAAVFLSLNVKNEEYWECIRKHIIAMLYFGYCANFCYDSKYLTEEMIIQSIDIDGVHPKPMAIITGIHLSKLKDMVNEFNANLVKEKFITLSLINTHNLHIISAHEDSMFQFRKKTLDFFKENEVTWEYLNFISPYHNPHYEKGYYLFKFFMDKINYYYKGTDLKTPVYSTYDGSNLQEIDDLAMYLYQLNSMLPLNWLKCVNRIKQDEYIDCILDFGPGLFSTFITKQLLENDDIKFLNLTRKKDQATFLN